MEKLRLIEIKAVFLQNEISITKLQNGIDKGNTDTA